MLAQLLTLKHSALGTYAKETSQENQSFPPFSEELFAELLSLERKRAERSRRPFLLMLVHARQLLQVERPNGAFARLAIALCSAKRETDICGWHKKDSVIGVIFTELGSVDTSTWRDTISPKVHSALQSNLAPSELEGVRISFHVFPEDPGSQNGGSEESRVHLYPDIHRQSHAQKAARLIKKLMDVAGSFTALIVLSPVFLGIAIAIKLTSKGPIFFKQERVGQYGRRFTFLKFRSMYFLNDATVHQEYVKRFISGQAECKRANGNGGAYKLTGDPRITPVGKFLRRTSLDELPQFFNVLRGDMSLVGPRPPIPYETEAYDIWHRRRFLEVQPGITGLWQVKGRSKLKFDEMVRLDIKYARDWSLGLDLKILLATPRAVFFGDGAY